MTSDQIAKIAVDYDIHEFIRGQKDCKNGIAHKEGNGESYDKGYACEYELEQIRGRHGIN